MFLAGLIRVPDSDVILNSALAYAAGSVRRAADGRKAGQCGALFPLIRAGFGIFSD